MAIENMLDQLRLAGLMFIGLVASGSLIAQDSKVGFQWSSSSVLIGPEQGRDDPCDAIKDPTVVYHDGRWHVFATIRSQKTTHQIEYLNFSDWNEADRSPRQILRLPDGYGAAPQVFFSDQLRKWCLLYQAKNPQMQPGIQPVLLTNTHLDDPTGWTERTLLWTQSWKNCPRAIDFWLICDDTHARLFFTSNNGKLWRSDTPLDRFPNEFGEPLLVLEGDFFEASCTYKLLEQNRYLTLIEAEKSGKRCYFAWTAESLTDTWQPLSIQWNDSFASRQNVEFQGNQNPWSENISHGELLRTGNNLRMEVSPKELRFLYQGARDEEIAGREYGKIPWRLGVLTQKGTSPFDELAK